MYQGWLKSDSPYSADEIAEPRQDMNIKVAAFTVTQKLYKISNICFGWEIRNKYFTLVYRTPSDVLHGG